MKKVFKDLTGQRFGRLLVVCRGPNSKSKNAQFFCQCDCGVTTLVSATNIRRTVSCGCLQRESVIKLNQKKIKHGHKIGGKATPEYGIWRSIISRTSDHTIKNYGGRGITVCDRWKTSFENFLSDMGPRPSPEHSIDRVDNNGNYEPSNCRWATIIDQNNNKSSNIIITHNGTTKNISQWANYLGLKPYTIFSRLRLGWSFEKAITKPVKYRL